MPPRSYTPTQQKILNLLCDGAEHTLDEIRMAIKDDYADENAIKQMVHTLNKALPDHLTVRGKRYNGRGCKYRMWKAIDWSE